jgi:PAS domain S-box-containing protein
MKNNRTESLTHGDILIVDDNISNLKFLTDVLTKAGYQARPADDGRLALRSAKAKLPELILLDYKMPDLDGIEVCQRLKADPETRGIPVIFLSAFKEIDLKVKALEAGGIDYVTKPVETTELLVKIANHLKMYRLQRKLARQSKELLQEIEERKQAEKSLALAENHFRQLFEKAPLPYQSLDEEGHLIEVNTEWLSILGYNRDEVIGRSLADFLPANWKKTFENKFPFFKKEGEILGVEVEMLKRDGTPVLFSLNGKIASSKSHNSLQTHCILQNITEKMRIDKALRKSEERYRELFESTGDLVTRVDAEGKFIFVNHMGKVVFGFPPEELTGMTAFQFLHPDDQQATTSWFEECISKKLNQTSFENRQVNQKSGEVYHMLWTTNFHYDETGKLKGANGIGHDITERKQAEKKLKDLSEQLSLLLESLPVVVFTRKCTKDFALTFTSSRVKEMTGFSHDRFVDDLDFWSKHIHPEDKRKTLLELPLVVQEGQHYCQYRFLTATGEYKWFGCTRRLVKLPDGTNSHIVGTWKDITEEKALQRESDQRLQQIIQTDKLASLGEVVAGVAHEINNPNSFISYNIPLLEEIWQILEPLIDKENNVPLLGTPTGRLSISEYCQDMRESIESIKIGSKRINNVVTNLKDFARMDESPHLEGIQLNEVIEKTYNIVGAQMRKTASNIIFNLAPKLPPVMGHFQKIEQVLANFLINAGHAIHQKSAGKISIATHYIERLQSVAVTIEDNGIGMEPEIIVRLFEPFFTTRRDSGGTGLGLSVSYGIIQEHHGIIGVLSRPGVGTRFTILLPTDPKHARKNLQPTILLVGKEEKLFSLRDDLLTGTNEQKTLTVSRQENIIPFLAEHPEVDLVYSSIKSDHINGWQLLLTVKTYSPLLRVILSAESPDECQSNPTVFEADCLLQKPFQTKDLLDCMENFPRIRL